MRNEKTIPHAPTSALRFAAYCRTVREAQALADETGQTVNIFSSEGILVLQLEPGDLRFSESR